MEIQLILAAYIVYFGMTYVQPHEQRFQNLFNSIAQDYTKSNEVSLKVLEQEVTRERQVFDVMKEELQFARNKKANKKRYFFEKNKANEDIVARKRETHIKEKQDLDTTRLIPDLEGIENEFMEHHPCDWNRDIVWEQMDHLTRESHKKICDHILPEIATPMERLHVHEFRYVEVPPHVKVKSVRFIDRAVLPIPECVPVPRIPVLECQYKEKKFYVTHADEKHVFSVEREPHTEIIFKLTGLIIPIDYEKLSI